MVSENYLKKGVSHEKHHYFNSCNNHFLHAILRNQNVVRDAGIRSLCVADDLGNRLHYRRLQRNSPARTKITEKDKAAGW